MRKLVSAAILLLVISCEVGSDTSTEKFVIDTTQPLAERIVLIDLDGNRTALSDYKGKTVFLNFWATWCKPCIKEMPSIDEARKSLNDEDIVFLAASDERMEKIQKFANGTNYGFDIVQVQGDIFDLDIKALPTTFIVNDLGEIVYNEVGAREWNSPESITLIRNHIK